MPRLSCLWLAKKNDIEKDQLDITKRQLCIDDTSTEASECQKTKGTMTSESPTAAPSDKRCKIWKMFRRKNKHDVHVQPSKAPSITTSEIASPWLKAYQELKEEDSELIQEYERQVNEVLAKHGVKANPSDKESLDQIISSGLKHFDEARIRIAGHTVQEGLEKAAKIIELAKGIIDQAVAASPQASLAWSIISLGIPILTHLAAAEKECKEGFTYTVGRMNYYIELEPKILDLGSNMESGVITFYKVVLDYLIRCVLRFYRSKTSNLVGDVLQLVDWKGMLEELKKEESLLYQNVIQSSSLAQLQELAGLNVIAKEVSEKLNSLDDICTQQLEVQKDHRDIAAKSFNLQEETSKRKVIEEQEIALQLFRLSDTSIDISYEALKKRNSIYVEGTCKWFTKDSNYIKWMQQDSGPLIVTANPGCGKSVLAAYLIDDLSKRESVCYFFFKDQIQQTLRHALCALLHQLFSMQRSLLEHAMPFKSGNGSSLVTNIGLLWSLFLKVVDSFKKPLTIVIDAIDECKQADRDILLNNLREYLPKTSAKFILTSRPYGQITETFTKFPHIRIAGEGHSAEISVEINLVIESQLKDFHWSEDLKEHVKERLCQVKNRTYLWVHLVLDDLRHTRFKQTPKGFDEYIKKLPINVNQAYEKILSRTELPHKPSKGRKIFPIILAASRPLTLAELQLAYELHSGSSVDSHEKLDLESPSAFEETLRNVCGLLIVIQDDRVYLFHQTVKEFLLSKEAPGPTNERLPAKSTEWGGSIDIRQAHTVLARSCIAYLHLAEFQSGLKGQGDRKQNDNHSPWYLDKSYNRSKPTPFPFLKYSANRWNVHFEKGSCDKDWSCDKDEVLVTKAIALCTYSEGVFQNWQCASWRRLQKSQMDNRLQVATFLGSATLVKILLKRDKLGLDSILEALLEAKKNNYEALGDVLEARKNNYNALGGVLLRHAIQMERNNPLYPQLLVLAAFFGQQDLVDTLLEHNVSVDSDDENGETALHQAALWDHPEIAATLLKHHADPNHANRSGSTPLYITALWDHSEIAATLLKHHADPNHANRSGSTPLHMAAEWNNIETTATLLANPKSNVNAQDEDQNTALFIAAKKGHKEMARLLIQHNADPTIRNKYGCTAIGAATREGHVSVAALLSERKVVKK